jgi:glycosyltransferase involved in cell wall biosynthesis
LDAGLITELVISDGGSSDETCKLADAWGARIEMGPPSRGGQLRRGCAAARGLWFLILHADTVLSPGWSETVAEHLSQANAGYFKLRFDRGGQAVAAWANARARLFGLPFGDQGLLIRRDLYERVGGFADQPLMEDVAMARALRGQLSAIDTDAVTSAARYRAKGWLRRGARNLWMQARYFVGVSPEVLARSYRK